MTTKHLFALLMVTTLGGCSSPTPKPVEASGEIVPANEDAAALAELIRAARAGLPKQTRFTASRGQEVRQVMAGWAKQANLKLVWKASTTGTTPAAIDEPDIRSAIVALALVLKDDPDPLLVEFPDQKTIFISQFGKAP